MRTTAPLLEAIIKQGCDEGVFDTGHPREADPWGAVGIVEPRLNDDGRRS